MARIRTIKPEFCTSESTSRLTRAARLFFLLLLTEADDKGRLVYSAKRLAGCLFPHDEDVTPRMVEKWIKECEGQEMLRRYDSNGSTYLAVVNFSRHQRVNRPTPSRLPHPPWDELDPEDAGSDSVSPHSPEVGTEEVGNRSPNPKDDSDLISEDDRSTLLGEDIPNSIIEDVICRLTKRNKQVSVQAIRLAAFQQGHGTGLLEQMEAPA